MRCEGKPCCDTGANKNTEPRSEARRQLLAASWAVRLHKSSGDRFIQGSERDPCLLYFQFLYSLRKCGYQETCCYGCVGVERQKGPMLKRHSALRKITEKKKNERYVNCRKQKAGESFCESQNTNWLWKRYLGSCWGAKKNNSVWTLQSTWIVTFQKHTVCE